MCLSVEIARPDAVLARGEHAGHEYRVVHNGLGHRCGYVKVEPGHPWHGKDYEDIDADCHGGLTFARADVKCGSDAPDDGWWVGFDCCHGGDAPDYSLPGEHHAMRSALARLLMAPAPRLRDVIRDTAFVEGQCKSLCEQAAMAAV